MKVREEYGTFTTLGSVNADTSNPSVAPPPTLAIGDLYGIAVVYAQATTTSTVITPDGFTTAKPAADAAQRQMVVHYRAIKTSADLTAAQSTIVRCGAASTRIGAITFAITASEGTGPNLDAPVASIGAWRVTSTGATVNNYFAPATDTGFVLYPCYSNNAATTTHPVHTSPWGTLLKQVMALDTPGTGSVSDSVLSLSLGGTNTTFSVATANSGSYGLAVASVTVAVADTQPVGYVTHNGVKTKVRLRYFDTPAGVRRTVKRIISEATDPEPTTDTPTEGLWFNSTDIQTPLAYDNIVTAHSFPPYPLHIGSGDYYANNYFPITAQSTNEVHFAEGGFLRNGPIAPARVGADDLTQDVNDHKLDIQRATVMGIDVFVIDVISESGNNAVYIERLIQARDEMGPGPYTYLTPMLDCNGGVVENGGAAAAALWIAKHKGKNGTWILPDGRMPVGAFKMEDTVDTPPAFWVELTGILQNTYGIRPAYMGAMNGFSATAVNNIKDALVAAGYTDAFYAVGPWGVGGQDPAIVASSGNHFATARGTGLKAYIPIQGQNIRPGTSPSATGVKVPAGKTGTTPHGLYDEAVGTEALRAGWAKVHTQGADLVQYVTWNDYSEGGEVQPSLAKGWCVADLSTWEAYRYKTGAYPEILRDNVILSHRSQFVAVDGPEDVSNTLQTAFMWQWERGGTETTPQDIVEALVFLTATSTVEITVGSTVTTTPNVPAGMTSVKAPLGAGVVKARILRSGTEVIGVTSPVKVVTNPVTDDKQYFMFSALRGTAGQTDPTDNKTVTMAGGTTPPVTTTVAAVMNIGTAAGKNHYEVQTTYKGATAFTHPMSELIAGYQRDPGLMPSTDGTRVDLRTPVDGKILPGSSWPRQEFRGVNRDGTKQAYNAKVGEHWQHQRGKLLHIPPNKSEIVLSQLHNGAADRIALRIQKTGTPNNRPRLIWRVNGAEVYVFKDPIVVGDEWRAAWRVGGAGVADGVVRLYDGDMTTPVYTSAASKLVATAGITTWYDKVGNYLQTTDGNDPENPVFYDVSTEYGLVQLWDVRHGHSYWGETNALGYPF